MMAMPDMVKVTGAVILGICSIILLVNTCKWITKALDNRQYRLETDRKVRLERAQHEKTAEEEGWREYNEAMANALAAYAKENYQMRMFMQKTKVTDVFGKWKEEQGGYNS